MRVTLGHLGTHWDYFGVIFGIREAMGDFGIISGALWSPFGYTKVRFRKNTHFPLYFNDFIKIRGRFCTILVHFEVTLGSL